MDDGEHRVSSAGESVGGGEGGEASVADGGPGGYSRPLPVQQM